MTPKNYLLFYAKVLFLIAIIAATASQTSAEPIAELIWPDGAPLANGDDQKDKPRMFSYLPDATTSSGAAIVIFPGGGYRGLAMGHEGHEIAKWFRSIGMAAFICDYRHRGKGYGHPAPLQDAQRTIRIARSRAKELGYRADKIGVIGFSAGGHLASTTITHFDNGNSEAEDTIDRASCRPDFAILCYPVIAFGQPYSHHGSQRNLLGKDADAETVDSLSNERQVKSNTPPTFLWHTSEDRGVPAENSVVFYLALRKHNIPSELHVFERGGHGLGLAARQPAASKWPSLCEAWLRGRGILPASAQ